MSDGARPRTLLVLGLARSGIAAARVAAEEGWHVLVTDDREAAGQGLPPGVDRIEAGEAIRRIGSGPAAIDLLIPSPGVPASHPVLEAARRAGVRIAPEIEFAADRLQGTLVAITGTNGKSTTVSLVGAMLAEAGRSVFVGGNLGDPLCNAVGRGDEIVVAEVSSFQLEHATTFHPHVGAMLNLTPDHLDRHGDMEGYLAAKLKLFARMTASDFAVLPAEAPWRKRAEASTRAAVSHFDVGDAAATRALGRGDYRVRLPQGGWPELPHDLENAAAALEVARLLAVAPEAAERAIAAFRPLRHRLARVADARGVSYWNDSKATNVGATLSSLRAFSGHVVLLAGGVSKGCDFAALASEASRITLVVAYGAAAPEIEAALAGRIRVAREAGLRTALVRASKEAVAGDSVLLAPACASFDEFRDYADRGESFERWVRELAQQVEQAEPVEKEEVGR
ncbi:MAG TPA: UDP-N-acetylmuramoyl-L-alanine--D-glutamate ligase [Candidatus Binatia bacterium]